MSIVSIGVAVATVTDLEFQFFGACIALAWIVPSAINKILWSNLQQQDNWTALAYVSPHTLESKLLASWFFNWTASVTYLLIIYLFEQFNVEDNADHTLLFGPSDALARSTRHSIF